MAVTSLIAEDEHGVEQKLQFHSYMQKEVHVIKVFACDAKFKPVGKPKQVLSDKSIEDYHKELRKASAEKGHLITSFSTNPEWNPEGYSKKYVAPMEERYEYYCLDCKEDWECSNPNETNCTSCLSSNIKKL